MALLLIHWIIIGSISFVFLLASGITTFIILNNMRWNFKYTDAENLAGNGYTFTRKGRCRLVGFGDTGEEIFQLKPKLFAKGKFRPAYGKRVGNKEILWMIGSDGYPYNCTLGDLNKSLLEVGVNPVDRDMRYAYASARKGLGNRYDKKSFMEKYGTYIAFGMLFFCILAMSGFLWLAFEKQKDIVIASSETIKTAKEVMELARQILANLDNLKTGGSGFVTT